MNEINALLQEVVTGSVIKCREVAVPKPKSKNKVDTPKTRERFLDATKCQITKPTPLPYTPKQET